MYLQSEPGDDDKPQIDDNDDDEDDIMTKIN